MNNTEMLANANANNALQSILGNFSIDYIIDVTRGSINQRWRPYGQPSPGIGAYDKYFTGLINQVESADYKAKINDTRIQTYNVIMRELCLYYQLEFVPNEDTDIYTVTYHLYNILVANFTQTLISFFVRYIIAHKDDIYSEATANGKVTKEDISSHSRKIYNDPKLGYIHTNIGTVVDNICVADITLEDIITYGTGDPLCKNYIMSCINEIRNVFRDHFAVVLQSDNRADAITAIRLALQEYATSTTPVVPTTR